MLSYDNQVYSLERRLWLGDLRQGKPFGGGKSNGDSRIEMGTRDVTNRVNQHCDNQPPNNCYPRKCYHVVVILVHHN